MNMNLQLVANWQLWVFLLIHETEFLSFPSQLLLAFLAVEQLGIKQYNLLYSATTNNYFAAVLLVGRVA